MSKSVCFDKNFEFVVDIGGIWWMDFFEKVREGGMEFGICMEFCR